MFYNLKRLLLLGILTMLSQFSFAQVTLTTIGGIEKDNYEFFTGAGLASTPAAGQLDSDTYAIRFLSGGTVVAACNFGDTCNAGEFAKGIGNGSETDSGIYAYNHVDDKIALGVNLGSSFTSSDVTVQIDNGTGVLIEHFLVTYRGRYKNIGDGAMSINVSVSNDGSTFTAVPAGDIYSKAIADGEWKNVTPQFSLVPASAVASGGTFYLRFTIAHPFGDEPDGIAIDDLQITALSGPPPPPEPAGTGVIGGTVFYDENDNGVQDPGEDGTEGIKVFLFNQIEFLSAVATTDSDGMYIFEGLTPGDYWVKVDVPDGYTPGTECPTERDHFIDEGRVLLTVNFCFKKPPVGGGCSYTIGFWKTHPEAWPVDELTLGGVTYNQAELLDILNTQPRGDKTLILAHQLIGTKLNLANGADGTDLGDTIAEADAWLAANGGVGSGEKKWNGGEPLKNTMDDYNNGLIGPGHCDDAGNVTNAMSQSLDKLFVPLQETPATFSLDGNYPNPFNPQTTITFSVAEIAHVRLAVYDMLGRELQVLVDGTMEAGQYTATFEASDLPSGTYLYRLVTPQGTFSNKMVLTK